MPTPGVCSTDLRKPARVAVSKRSRLSGGGAHRPPPRRASVKFYLFLGKAASAGFAPAGTGVLATFITRARYA